MKCAFVDSLPVRLKLHKFHISQCGKRNVRRCGTSVKDLRACIARPDGVENVKTPGSIDGFVSDEVDFDTDVVSDDTHVVIDSKDVNYLIQQLQLSGEDILIGSEQEKEEEEGKQDNTGKKEIEKKEKEDAPGFDTEFFKAAEKLSDTRQGRTTQTQSSVIEHVETMNINNNLKNGDGRVDNKAQQTNQNTQSTHDYFNANINTQNQQQLQSEYQQQEHKQHQIFHEMRRKDEMINSEPMKYFTNENKQYMPSWVREMYENNEHDKLENGSNALIYGEGLRRLHEIIERRNTLNHNEDNNNDNIDEGITDCTIGDVAEDYYVPMEFIVDALITLGVRPPIKQSHSIRNSLTNDEIHRLLNIFMKHDATVLAERYSDRSILELADDYDLDVRRILKVCEQEGFYLHDAEQTHLSLIREDRILDIIIKDEPLGKPYPSLLEGLE